MFIKLKLPTNFSGQAFRYNFEELKAKVKLNAMNCDQSSNQISELTAIIKIWFALANKTQSMAIILLFSLYI